MDTLAALFGAAIIVSIALLGALLLIPSNPASKRANEDVSPERRAAGFIALGGMN